MFASSYAGAPGMDLGDRETRVVVRLVEMRFTPRCLALHQLAACRPIESLALPLPRRRNALNHAFSCRPAHPPGHGAACRFPFD